MSVFASKAVSRFQELTGAVVREPYPAIVIQCEDGLWQRLQHRRSEAGETPKRPELSGQRKSASDVGLQTLEESDIGLLNMPLFSSSLQTPNDFHFVILVKPGADKVT